MITASQNPKEYNGFKMCRRNAEPLSDQEGLRQIRELIQNEDFLNQSVNKGVTVRKNVSVGYAEHCLSFIDPGNGMAGITLPPVLKELPLEETRLYFDLDGTFPNHPVSPLEPENPVDLQRSIAETNADFGVAFDGDADRMFLVDRNGTQLGGDMDTAMVARSLLAKQPGQTVVYNLICSRAVREVVTEFGGRPVRTRVGHALIKGLMKEHDAIFGGEHSGQFYFRDNWFAYSGLIAFLVCLELLSIENRPLHEVVAEIDHYARSGELNSRVASINDKIAEVKEAFRDGEQDELDGLTVQYDSWWFNLRPSNTESLLRLNVEASGQALPKEKTAELLRLIRA